MRGGIEQLCRELADAMHGLGTELHVLAPHAPGDRAHDAALPYAVTRYRRGRMRHVNLARALDAALRAGSKHVLFGQWTAAGIPVASELLARRGVRFAALGHAKEFLPAAHGVRSTPMFAAYQRTLLRQLHPVLCVSRYTASIAGAAGAADVQVLHPGVDTQRFAPDTSAPMPVAARDLSRPLLLTVARLVTRKVIDTVIEALPSILTEHPTLTYAVVGDGPDRERLQALAARLGVASHVAFVGAARHDELPAWYRAADIFVLASRQEAVHGDVEGFGLVLLEAQACGTPVIAADSGGMPDALRPGETGTLVPPSASEAVATAVRDMLADRTRLAQMATAARAYALSQAWPAVAQRALSWLGA
jgi:phosphatidylinositol alpha-1,6-mannosyltransferase